LVVEDIKILMCNCNRYCILSILFLYSLYVRRYIWSSYRIFGINNWGEI